MYIYRDSKTHKQTLKHTYTHTLFLSLTHSHTHTHTHTHSLSLSHTHTQLHIPSLSLEFKYVKLWSMIMHRNHRQSRQPLSVIISINYFYSNIRFLVFGLPLTQTISNWRFFESNFGKKILLIVFILIEYKLIIFSAFMNKIDVLQKTRICSFLKTFSPVN
jgi:hypothetical protein